MANYGPIETYYGGINFRSKNEAKWACFFDLAGIKYEYEPKVFTGWNHIKYKPDFYFPKYEKYAEVKSSPEAIQEEYMAKKINSVIDFNATEISNGLLLLGSFPYDVRIITGLYMELKWLFHKKGVCLGTAVIGEDLEPGNAYIHFIATVEDVGDPIPASASTEVITRQSKYDNSDAIYRLIEKVNNTIK